MHSLFQQSYNTALLNLDKNTKEPVQSKKLDALEAELRSENKEQKIELSNELAGAAPVPNPDMRQKLQQYAPHDVGFKYYGNKLGDYSSLLSQQREDAQRLVQPMLASTLENQKESHKLASANDDLSMLANQFGLHARSNRVYKKAKKVGRMNVQDHFL